MDVLRDLEAVEIRQVNVHEHQSVVEVGGHLHGFFPIRSDFHHDTRKQLLQVSTATIWLNSLSSTSRIRLPLMSMLPACGDSRMASDGGSARLYLTVKKKTGPSPTLLLHFELSAVHLHELLADRQPESGAAVLARRIRRSLSETLEDLVEPVGRMPIPVSRTLNVISGSSSVPAVTLAPIVTFSFGKL